MRIAYLVNYQGPDIIARRGIHRSLALAGSQKAALIAQILSGLGAEVVLFSIGVVAERKGKWHASVASAIHATPPVLVKYCVAWDVPLASQFVALTSLWHTCREDHRRRPFDVVICYNCSLPETAVALDYFLRQHVPVVLEYEDDTVVYQNGSRGWRNVIWTALRNRLRKHVRAVFAPSPELLAQFDRVPHRLLLRGILGDDLQTAVARKVAVPTSPFRVMFTGTLQHSKGVTELCRAWVAGRFESAELHVIGDGALAQPLKASQAQSGIVFHGRLSRAGLVQALCSAHIFVNPHVAVKHAPGNVFPFKMIEYLGAGCPVVSTRMGYLEPELEQSVLYTESNDPAEIADAIRQVMSSYPLWAERAKRAQAIVWQRYGSGAVGHKLANLLAAACASPRN